MNNNKLTKRLGWSLTAFFIVITASFGYATTSPILKNNSLSVPNLAEAFTALRQRSLFPPTALDRTAEPMSENEASLSDKEAADDPNYVPAVTNDIDASIEEAYGDDQSAPQPEQPDPYESFNRAMFTFNDKIDVYILKPIATLYNKIIPVPLNQGIHNIFFNINTLPTIANDILQANFYQAANDMWRVGINTTIGIGGLFDVAERMQLEPYTNDFGLTMARWGYANSNYLVLPFFGPNTVRDGLGIPVDYFAFSLYPYINPPSLRYEVYGLGIIDKRAQLLKFQDVLEEAALDRYVFVKSAYLQRRTHQIKENQHRGCCDQLAVKRARIPASDKSYD